MTEIEIRSVIAPELICGDDSEYLFPEFFKKDIQEDYYSELVDSCLEEEIVETCNNKLLAA